jgi:hypothetical protein
VELLADKTNLWVHMLGALGNVSRGIDSSCQPAPKSGRKGLLVKPYRSRLPAQEASVFSPCVRINVLECFDGNAVIEWIDPTGGHYAEQRWHRCITRRRGICALSGDVIVRGDCVFRPARRVPEPVNSQAMILARTLPILRSI